MRLSYEPRQLRRVAAAGEFGRVAVLFGAQDFEAALERLKLPLIVKPATQGSSVGMSKVERAADLPAAYALAARLETLVFAEAWIVGPEYTVAILQERELPSIRIE